MADFRRGGRTDIVKAVERWGGVYELAKELGYLAAGPRASDSDWSDHVSEVAAQTGMSGRSVRKKTGWW